MIKVNKGDFRASALNILLAIFFTFSLISCGADTNFTVEGKLDNVSFKDLVVVKQISIDSLVVDTIDISSSGEFSFKGEVDAPTMTALFCGENPISFVLEPNYDVVIKGDVTQPGSIQITGGTVNDDIYTFKQANAETLELRNAILSKKSDADVDSLRSVELKLARSVRDYVRDNPTKISSAVLLNEYCTGNSTLALLGESIGYFRGAVLDFYLTTNLKTYYEKTKISSVGSIAPPITLQSTAEKQVSLADFKEKPILLIFDLKDTLIDESHLDSLKSAHKKLKGKVNFLTIVIDENLMKPSSKTIETAKDLDWTVLLDSKKWNSQEVKKYNIATAPYMILISSEGLVEERGVSLDSLVKRFDKAKIQSIQ